MTFSANEKHPTRHELEIFSYLLKNKRAAWPSGLEGQVLFYVGRTNLGQLSDHHLFQSVLQICITYSRRISVQIRFGTEIEF